MGTAISRDQSSLSIGLKSKTTILDSVEFSPQISTLLNNLAELRSRIEKEDIILNCPPSSDCRAKVTQTQTYNSKLIGDQIETETFTPPVPTVEDGHDELIEGNTKHLISEKIASSAIETAYLTPKPHNMIIKLDSVIKPSSSKAGRESIRSAKSSESNLYRTKSMDVMPLSASSFSRSKPNEYSSPVAIKELLISAEGLLSRLQTAYAQRTSALHEMIISRDTLAEELEESNTRDQSLRSQLATLANTVTSKDLRIAELEREVIELKMQKSASTKSPGSTSPDMKRFSALPQFTTYSGQNLPSSDEDFCSTDSSIDLDAGAESDCESNTDDSIFSRPRSPALTSASSIMSRSPHLRPASIHAPTSFSLGTKSYSNKFDSKCAPQTQKSFLSFFMGHGSKIINQSAQNRCTNCSGKESSNAWDTVRILQIENQGLKERIVELEEAVDGALMLL